MSTHLARHLGRADWVVVDCRFTLTDPPPGARRTSADTFPARATRISTTISHGARARPKAAIRCRTPSDSRRRSAAGASAATTTVVAYDEASGAIAARLWWLLRWLGHERCAVLDGGLRRLARRRPPGRAELAERHAAAYASRGAAADAVVATEELAAAPSRRRPAGRRARRAALSRRAGADRSHSRARARRAQSAVLRQRDVRRHDSARPSSCSPSSIDLLGGRDAEQTHRDVRLRRHGLPLAARDGSRRACLAAVCTRARGANGFATRPGPSRPAPRPSRVALRQLLRSRLADGAGRGKDTPPISQLRRYRSCRATSHEDRSELAAQACPLRNPRQARSTRPRARASGLRDHPAEHRQSRRVRLAHAGDDAPRDDREPAVSRGLLQSEGHLSRARSRGHAAAGARRRRRRRRPRLHGQRRQRAHRSRRCAVC